MACLSFGLPKILMRSCVVAAKQFLSGHPWLFILELLKNACNGAHHSVICNSLVGRIWSCHLVKYMMVKIRATLVSPR